MQIETTNKYTGLNGGREVWVRVYSDEVVDWRAVQAKLTEGQAAMLENLGKRTMSYFPHSPTPAEREDHGWLCEDWFVWASTARRKATR